MKGISPMIALVIIIGLVAGIGAIFYTWSSGMIKLQASKVRGQSEKIISWSMENLEPKVVKGNEIDLVAANPPEGYSVLGYKLWIDGKEYQILNKSWGAGIVIQLNQTIPPGKRRFDFTTTTGRPWTFIIDIKPYWFNSTWKYRKGIVINNANSSIDYQEYPLLVILDTSKLISEGKMNPDCSDIRFADETGHPLNYWIEYGCNTTETKIWVKVPRIKAYSTPSIYFYYGNPSASSKSNTTKVFPDLLAYWDFDEGEGNTLHDYVNGYNGTIYFHTRQLVNDMNSLDYWSGNNISLDSDTRIEGSSIKIEDAPAEGEVYTVVYNPPGTWDWSGKDMLSFYDKCNISGGSNFGIKRVYIYDASGNWAYWNIGFYYSSWSERDFYFGSYSGHSATLPDLSQIDYIKFEFNASTTDPFKVWIDYLEVREPSLVNWTKGIEGDAIHFNSDNFDDYVVGPISSKVTGIGYRVSFEVWIRPDDEFPSKGSLVRGYGYSPIVCFNDHWHPCAGVYYVDTSSSWGYCGDATADYFRWWASYYNRYFGMGPSYYSSPGWMHVVWIMNILDSNHTRWLVYENDTLEGNQTSEWDFALTQDETYFHIADRNAWWGQFFKGIVDEVRIWNRELTLQEIKQFTYGPPKIILSPEEVV